MAIKCPSCGHVALDDSTICTNCGNVLPLELPSSAGEIDDSDSGIGTDFQAEDAKKPVSLRKFLLVGGLCTFLGYFLVFVPVVEFLILPALLLSFIGIGILLAALIIYLRRSQSYERNFSLNYSILKGAYKVIVLGIITLFVIRIVESVVLPAPPKDLLPQPSETLVQGLTAAIVYCVFWGYSVGYTFVRYFRKIPFSNPTYKALLVSLVTMLIVNGLATFLHLNVAASYYLWSVAYSLPAYGALGVVLGYGYTKFDSEQAVKRVHAQPVRRRIKLYYYIAIAAFIGVFLVFNNYQNSIEPASFAASNVHLVGINGSVHVMANITNTSPPSLIQIDSSIDGQDAGICGYGIQTNQSMVCNFFPPSSEIPLLDCSQLPQAGNMTLTLNAYFGNTKTIVHTYTLERAQVAGCP
jgi:hypothetical protein